jgi:hypothetical protein
LGKFLEEHEVAKNVGGEGGVTQHNRFSKAVSKLLSVAVVGGATLLPTVAESASVASTVASGTVVVERLVAIRAAAQSANQAGLAAAADDDEFKDTFKDVFDDVPPPWADSWKNTA